ncbi:CDP-glucose 4,6-dehydratase [Paenibacillus turpanensis]|uniref:CDP-glucose 4,6-dehydratase n=1 Tax=Paenibacillus turpanensis TaxID=2689078 RepID=UPI001409FF29|nr:CDP-glucose 4,6-dehydratase [Paenibacillus turpanensis]
MNAFWNGKKVLVTGHTGFKGSWLSLWLHQMGAEVIGFSLYPDQKPNMFEALKMNQLVNSIYGNICDRDKVIEVMNVCKPEIVFHLAAQALVRDSYENPFDTYQTNVMGTLNVLEAARQSGSVRTFISVTSDKCYENTGERKKFVETDPLGGFDPYSSSKACADILTSSYYNSFLKDENIHVATVRAGNVIGGGDWAKDRLVPDLIKSITSGRPESVVIRNPNAVRPWQHVLEPISGYLIVAREMHVKGGEISGAWNFGPGDQSFVTVETLVKMFYSQFNMEYRGGVGVGHNPYEAQWLGLDSSKAKRRIGWRPVLNLSETVEWTSNWYKTNKDLLALRNTTHSQISQYQKLVGER